MNTKTNKKSLLAILISSALALMLSVATLFTLPTFSASADAGQRSMTFNDVIQETEIITDGELNGNNYFRAYYEEGTKTVSFEYGAYVLTYMDGVWMLTNDGANVVITNMDAFNTISYGSYVDFYLPYMASVTNNECDCTSFYRARKDNGVYKLTLKDYTVKATADTEVITNRLIRVRRADDQPLYTEGDSFYFDGLSIGGGERLYISVRKNKVCINNYENDTVIALHRFEDNFMTYVDFYFNSEHYDGATLTHGHSSFNGDEYIFEELFLDVEEETNDGAAEEEKDDFWQGIKDTIAGWGDKGSAWLGDNLGVTISGSALIGAVLAAGVVIILFRRRK